MLLCLDIGNTHILGGVFKDQQLLTRFRYATHLIGTADQFGVFLINILQTHQINAEQISATALCSVVPSLDYTLRHTISLYFRSSSIYALQAGVKTGLNIKYKNPREVGSDRIANAIGAVNSFPNKDIIIVDLGTATTVCAINKKHDYLGGSILPGMRLAMESLKNNTAKLTEVDIERPTTYMGRTTRESIQTGLYYGHLGAIREIINGYKQEILQNKSALTIGTGGFAQLYKDAMLFDVILPDLVLQGLSKAHEYFLRNEKDRISK